jgi:hypothetical protein
VDSPANSLEALKHLRLLEPQPPEHAPKQVALLALPALVTLSGLRLWCSVQGEPRPLLPSASQLQVSSTPGPGCFSLLAVAVSTPGCCEYA